MLARELRLASNMVRPMVRAECESERRYERRECLSCAQFGGQLLFHLISRLCERTSIIVTTNQPILAEGRPCSRTRK